MDEYLYRARVLDIRTGEAEVVFIDYGNRETFSELYQLGEELRQLPGAAHRVGLCLEAAIENTPENRDQLEALLNGDMQVSNKGLF